MSLAEDLVQAAQIPGKYQQPTIEKAWDFLVPYNDRLTRRRINVSLCKYFFHLLKTLEGGQALPYDIPFQVRHQIDFRYHQANEWMEGSPRLGRLAKAISRLDGQEQGSTFVACLEHLMVKRVEPQEYIRFFCLVTKEVGQLQTIQEVGDAQMANFFATYVHLFRENIQQPERLQQIVTYLCQFWGFCSHLAESPQRRSSLFRAILAKLEVDDIPLCLWLFASVATATDTSSTSDTLLCESAEAEINGKTRYPVTEIDFRWLGTVVATTNFLLNVNYGFFETLGPLMVTCCGQAKFEIIW
ncbi:MAG: hypothetical protein L6R40_007995 [Gallowayella cf. fulva]|nr:MAG: hypothetical protein L6R40_007995 [Xanthomendoza cf. fulva]